MAQVIAGDPFKITGKIGDRVYVKYKGGIYVRKTPTVRKEARTPAMLLNQQRFACVFRFCSQFKRTIIPMIWNDAAIKGSGYNYFLKSNSPAFARDGSMDDPALLKFSVGGLLMPVNLLAERQAPGSGTILAGWEKKTHLLGICLKDELMMISGDGEQFSALTPTGLKRKDLEGIFELPDSPNPASHLYLFFASEDRRSFSESRCFKI